MPRAASAVWNTRSSTSQSGTVAQVASAITRAIRSAAQLAGPAAQVIGTTARVTGTLRGGGGRRLPRLEPRFEVLETASQADGLERPVLYDLGCLVSVARNADDDRIVAIDEATTDEIDRRGERSSARGFCEDALGLGEQLDRVDDLPIA